jgi:hypothetical protein
MERFKFLFEGVLRNVYGNISVHALSTMLLTQATFAIPAKAGIQENEDFPDPGFHRGDVKSTTLDSVEGEVFHRAPLHAAELRRGTRGHAYGVL